MSRPHAGRTALVTGAAAGLGQAYALRLAAEEAGFITGQTLVVDGGLVRT